MVRYGTLFTLFLAAVAQAHDDLYNGPHNAQPSPSSSSNLPATVSPSPSTGSSFVSSILSSSTLLPSGTGSSGPSSPPLTTSLPEPVVSYVTVFETKTTTQVEYKTVTRTKTIESCPTPGSPNQGKPTLVVKPNDKPTTTSRSPPQSTQTLLPTSVKPPPSPTPSPTPTPDYPEEDEDEEDCEDEEDGEDEEDDDGYDEEEDDGDDEDCEEDEQDDLSSGLPISSSVEPKPSSSGSSTNPGVIPPPTLIAVPSTSVPYPVPSSTAVDSPGYSSPAPYPVPSSTVVGSPGYSSPAPVPPSSSTIIPSPASSVTSSTDAPKPTSAGKYDRNAICGNQKREPNPLEAVPQISRRDLRRRITY